MVDRKRRLDCANGIRKADIVLKHGKVLNVFTEEILEADVAICGDTIVGVGSYEGEREIDCTGKYLVPGFLDVLRIWDYVSEHVVKLGNVPVLRM